MRETIEFAAKNGSWSDTLQTTGTLIFSSKVIERATRKLIKSNERIAESNDRYTSAMTILTAGLFFVGLVQMFVQAMQVFENSIPVFIFFTVAIVLLFAFPFRSLLIDLLKKK
jgi:hypothetical protein